MKPHSQAQARVLPAIHQEQQMHTVIKNGVEITVLQNHLDKANIKHKPLLKKKDCSAMSNDK
jgi:hypothetical protein